MKKSQNCTFTRFSSFPLSPETNFCKKTKIFKILVFFGQQKGPEDNFNADNYCAFISFTSNRTTLPFHPKTRLLPTPLSQFYQRFFHFSVFSSSSFFIKTPQTHDLAHYNLKSNFKKILHDTHILYTTRLLRTIEIFVEKTKI